MYDIDILTLGKKVKDYRKARGISIEELGNAIGKSKSTVNRYETGEIVMDIITVLEICNTLNIDINDICDLNVQNVKKEETINPFNTNLLYLYYISKNGIVVSSLISLTFLTSGISLLVIEFSFSLFFIISITLSLSTSPPINKYILFGL